MWKGLEAQEWSRDCKLCKERGKTWNGDNPKCAFVEGIFNRNNWNCATMNYLRDIIDELSTGMRNDSDSASIGYIPFGDIENGDYLFGNYNSGYIVLTWYKNQGKTGNAIVMRDDLPIQELGLDLALKVIEHYKREEVVK